jgi:hypothetical protein
MAIQIFSKEITHRSINSKKVLERFIGHTINSVKILYEVHI